MKIFIFCCSVIIATVVNANVCVAQDLWNGAAFGMTVEEVQALFPNAIKPYLPDDQLEFSQGSKEYITTNQELLRIENITFVNKTFYTSFYFNHNKLYEVRLSIDQKYNYNEMNEAYNDLIISLTKKYGKEIDPDKYIWVSDGKLIKLSFHGINYPPGQGKYWLEIFYDINNGSGKYGL